MLSSSLGDECPDDKTNAYIRDETEYEYVIWNEHIMCSKQMQTQIGGTLFVISLLEWFVYGKTKGVYQDLDLVGCNKQVQQTSGKMKLKVET